MSDVKHTALPWEVEYDSGDSTPVVVFQSRDICRVDKRDGEGNARYIVTACNAYPALVKALREITDRFERLEKYYFAATHQVSDGEAGEVIRARAALSLALAQAQGDE